MPGGLKSLAPEGARPPQGRGRQLRRPLWKLGGMCLLRLFLTNGPLCKGR
jgi:hypothetical protein